MQLPQSGRRLGRIFRGFCLSLVVLGLLGSLALASGTKLNPKNLPPTYRKWLTEEVIYIITDEEKDAFLQLPSDEARDKFIDHFWAIRNPNPGAPTNSYKDEIYRRIAYANQWYGHRNGLEGWRSDRGRVYITLGAPQQTGKYLGFANIRPMEIWFYSNDNPALPPYFYVVFYQREVGDEMRLYSPFMDGPEKLITAALHENDRLGSWKIIDHDAGREVSRTVLSLLPSEPVDIQTATSSMASDMLLNDIRGLANHPLNKDMLRERSNLLEAVSHRVILHGDYLDVLTVPLIDATGETNLHYVLRMKRPEDFSLAEADGKYYYSATVTARVLTGEGKLIFTQQRKLSEYVDDRTYLKLRSRVFGFEGLLPLPPGKYKVEFQLGDDIKRTTFPAQREIIIPDRPADGLRITEVVPFFEAVGNQAVFLPFSVAGVRFTPALDSLSLVPGQDLEFFYQLWRAPKASAAPDGKLQVEYAYGRMGLHDTKTISEDLDENQFDGNGGLINGKKIPTADLQPGGYRMAITITDPTTRARSVASFQFRVADGDSSPRIWDVNDPQAAEDFQKGVRDHQRALCYLAQGNQEGALNTLRKAYGKNRDESTRNMLVGLLYAKQDFAEVADLYSHGGVTENTDEKVILDIAESFNHLGQLNNSIKVLESALPLRHSSALYLSLARYYQQSGETQKAAEMEQKAKAVSPEPTT